MAATHEGPIDILRPQDYFPDLAATERLLYPGSIHQPPSLDDYRQSLALQGRLNAAVDESLGKARELQGTTSTIVYIAGPLTGVSEELKARYGQISDLMRTYAAVGDGKPHAFLATHHTSMGPTQ